MGPADRERTLSPEAEGTEATGSGLRLVDGELDSDLDAEKTRIELTF
jgi:hypothetical protein